jgi:hypothetical protein
MCQFRVATNDLSGEQALHRPPEIISNSNQGIAGNGGAAQLNVTEIPVRYTRACGEPWLRQSCCLSRIPDVEADTFPPPSLFLFDLFLVRRRWRLFRCARRARAAMLRTKQWFLAIYCNSIGATN